MIRFFADLQDIDSFAGCIRLSREDADHIHSLRLRPDEHFIVCNGHGIDYTCKLGQREDVTVAKIVGQNRSRGEPTVKCSVYIAYQKGDRLDYAVQKAVELGVYEIILFESKRCVAVPGDVQKKTARLQRIALETAKLSGRGRIPSVTSGGMFKEIIKNAANHSSLLLFFYENESDLHIKGILDQHFQPGNDFTDEKQNSVSVVTGPEGGFEPHEAEMARAEGFNIVSLGPRILRSETAPAAALAAIMYQSGNF